MTIYCSESTANSCDVLGSPPRLTGAYRKSIMTKEEWLAFGRVGLSLEFLVLERGAAATALRFFFLLTYQADEKWCRQQAQGLQSGVTAFHKLAGHVPCPPALHERANRSASFGLDLLDFHCKVSRASPPRMEENRLSPVTGAIIACDATQRNKKGAVRRRRPSSMPACNKKADSSLKTPLIEAMRLKHSSKGSAKVRKIWRRRYQKANNQVLICRFFSVIISIRNI